MKILVKLALIVVAPLVSAQEFSLDRIVVTGSRIDTYGLPAVNIERPADFLAQSVRIVNDSRAPELRRQEILATLQQLQRGARRLGGIELSVGDEYLNTLRLDADALELKTEEKRADTSYLDLYIERRFDPQRPAADQIRELREFIREARMDGRSMLEPKGEIALSLVKPERYRSEILTAIADELQRIRGQFPAGCKLDVHGLAGRVQWMRVGTAQLALYIEHEIGIAGCEG